MTVAMFLISTGHLLAHPAAELNRLPDALAVRSEEGKTEKTLCLISWLHIVDLKGVLARTWRKREVPRVLPET